MKNFSFKSFLLLGALIALPVFVWFFFKGEGGDLFSDTNGDRTLKAGRDYQIEEGGKRVARVPDSDMLSTFKNLKEGFSSVDFSLVSPEIFTAEAITKKASDNDEKKTQTNNYAIGDVLVTTHYNETNNHTLDGFTPIKQTITLKNTANSERTIDFVNRVAIKTDEVTWNGKIYPITTEPQTFKAYEKTASVPQFAKDTGKGDMPGLEEFKNYTHTYKVGTSLTFKTEDHRALYDWSDAASLDPEIRVYQTKEGSFLEILIKNVTVSAKGERVIDPNFALSDSSSYDVRYDGSTPSPQLTDAGIVVGDVNGDGTKDLVLGAGTAEYNGSQTGSAFVVFGGAGIGSGDKPFDITTNYNIRYDGARIGDSLTFDGGIFIGDVNSDSLGDLVLNAVAADNNGVDSNSTYVMFSTLIDDVGVTTGNNKPLSTGTNYNIRYDGAVAGDSLFGMSIGDLNSDSLGDLVLNAAVADNNGANSGSVWVMFSTLIDDVGATTGNNKPLSTGTNYNIRYDGGAANDLLGSNREIKIGDVNSDSLGDLILGSDDAANNGGASGSAYVMFSTLIDDVGATTGNDKSLATGTNYNIRYDGAAAADDLTEFGNMDIGDLNGDSLGDLVLGADGADNNGSASGSTYVMFSTLIDDVGATTGNNKVLSTGTNYNIRYNGGAANDGLSRDGALQVGDVNGDSLGDLIVGAYSADNGASTTGSVYIMFSTLIDDVGATTGNSKNLNTGTNYNIRYDGANTFEQLGQAPPLVGDVNGDGLSDLILGVAGFSVGSASGFVYVMFSTLIDDVGATTGNNKGLGTNTNYNIYYAGAESNDVLSTSYIFYDNFAIADLNADSHPDFVVGSYLTDSHGANAGAAYVMFSTLIDDVGATTGNDKSLSVSSSYSIRYDGDTALPYLSNYGLLIGDVNGDSKKDLVISATEASYNGLTSGSVFVIFGGSSFPQGNKPLSTTTNYNIRYDGAAASDTMGKDFYIGDVNGDALGDLILVSGPPNSTAGAAYVMFSTLIDDVGGTTGNNKPLSTATNYNIRYDGAAAGDDLGNALLRSGDVNSDSLGDLVLSAHTASNNGSGSGSVYVMFSTLIDDVGATTGNNKSLATGTNYNIRYDGAAATNNLTSPGTGSSNIGDLNGDSLGDLVLNSSTFNSNAGAAYVMFSTLIDDVGATTGNNKPLSTATNYNIRYDGAASSNLTLTPTLIGDLNGDSLGDLVLGTYTAGNNGLFSGSAWVMFSTLIDDVGATTGNNKSLATGTNYNIRYDGAAVGSFLFTNSIADVNGDGLGDLILPLISANTFYVFFSTLIDDVGATTGNNKPLSTGTNYNIRYTAITTGVVAYYLSSVDINNDSLNDLVIGLPNEPNNGSVSGSVYILYSTLIDDVGATTGNNKLFSTQSTYSLRYDGSPGDTLGYQRSGDLNNDGSNDLAISGTTTSYNGATSGSVWVIFGGASMTTTPEFYLKGTFNITGPASFE